MGYSLVSTLRSQWVMSHDVDFFAGDTSRAHISIFPRNGPSSDFGFPPLQLNYHVILKQFLRHVSVKHSSFDISLIVYLTCGWMYLWDIRSWHLENVPLGAPFQAADLNLRFKILSEFACAHPVPLIYPRWFGDSTPDLFNVNGEILSVLDESICILSLGIGKCRRPCGNLAWRCASGTHVLTDWLGLGQTYAGSQALQSAQFL